MKNIFLILVGFFSFTVSGQNIPQFSQINFGQGIYNPAALSIDAKLQVDALIHQQWTGFKGIPVAGAIQGSYEFYEDMAAGAVISYDNIGSWHSFQFQAQYAYKIIFANTSLLSVGASVGFESKTWDLASTQVVDKDDPVFQRSYTNYFSVQAGFGLHFSTPKFYLGFSIPQMFQNNIFGPSQLIKLKDWNYFLSAGGYFKANKKYTFNPHIQLKAAVNTPINLNVMFRNTFANKWSFSLGYRTDHSLMAGIDLRFEDRFRIGYMFGYGLTKLGRSAGVSNEVFLAFGLPYYTDSIKNFSKLKHLNKKGGTRRDFRKGYKRRKWWK